jgi:hypothetical protein
MRSVWDERAETGDDERGLMASRREAFIGLVDESSAHRRRDRRSATRLAALNGVQQMSPIQIDARPTPCWMQQIAARRDKKPGVRVRTSSRIRPG